MPSTQQTRAFKTAWFAKAARKARISDGALLQAVRDVIRGQADDLGGERWVFAFLYAKKDRANIDPDELTAFRKLAQVYARITPSELEKALDEGALLELSDDH